jgi:hypothetical protein
MANYDIVVWEDTDGQLTLMPCTAKGNEWMVENPPSDLDFEDYLRSMKTLRVGILDPSRKILNFSPGVLH